MLIVLVCPRSIAGEADDDPLALLYLEPGAIAGTSIDTSPSAKRPRTASAGPSGAGLSDEGVAAPTDDEELLEDESAVAMLHNRAVSRLRELSVLCGEDADEILADVGGE